MQPKSLRPGVVESGFTLIEVMIVVAIVAILASVAYPSYVDHLRRGRLQEAPGALADYRARLEQLYQDNRNYGAGGACGLAAPATASFGYACVLTNGGQGYTVTATGTNALVTGFAYTVDQANAQTTTCTGCDWGFSTQNAWITRRP